MPNTITPSNRIREGLTAAQILRFFCIPFSPASLRTYLSVKRFENIPIDKLVADGIKGVLLDADGTLGSHQNETYSDSVVQHVNRMLEAGLKVAVYTNASEDRFSQFKGVSVVTKIKPKPDPKGFEDAMKNHLHLDDPSAVCMVGDNYITDGGAISAGMRFIHVTPLEGNENWFHRMTRYTAFLWARLYWGRKWETLDN